jgi:hypothetical protein
MQQTYVLNKQGFQDLTQKLEVLRSIVEDDRDHSLKHLIAPRANDLSECVNIR